MKIICEHLSKEFVFKNQKLRVLDDITEDIQNHDFICILGPNGCGKTTLLKIIAGILNEQKTSGIDIICHKANMPASKVAMLLLNLEFSNVVKSLPGKMYELI